MTEAGSHRRARDRGRLFFRAAQGTGPVRRPHAVISQRAHRQHPLRRAIPSPRSQTAGLRGVHGRASSSMTRATLVSERLPCKQGLCGRCASSSVVSTDLEQDGRTRARPPPARCAGDALARSGGIIRRKETHGTERNDCLHPVDSIVPNTLFMAPRCDANMALPMHRCLHTSHSGALL